MASLVHGESFEGSATSRIRFPGTFELVKGVLSLNRANRCQAARISKPSAGYFVARMN